MNNKLKELDEKVSKMTYTIITDLVNEIVEILESSLKEKSLELEDHNFKINSDGWKKITVNGKCYLENPEMDIWELLDSEYKGEQLFTYDAMMRETKKRGKRVPTIEEFGKILKVKDDLKNIKYVGSRDTSNSFNFLGSASDLWSCDSYASSGAWYQHLAKTRSTIFPPLSYFRTYGFSVRCIKD